MLQVRFDRETSAGLALVWNEPNVGTKSPDYSRAANLLFSIIGDDANGGNGDWWPKKPAKKPARRSRRKPRVTT